MDIKFLFEIIIQLIAIFFLIRIYMEVQHLTINLYRTIYYALIGILLINLLIVYFLELQSILIGTYIVLFIILYLMDPLNYLEIIYYISFLLTMFLFTYVLIRFLSRTQYYFIYKYYFPDFSFSLFFSVIILYILVHVFKIKFSLPKSKICIFILFSSISVFIIELIFCNQIQTISLDNLPGIIFYLFLCIIFFSNNIIIQYLYNDFHQLTIISKNNFLSKITDSYIQGIHNEQEKVFKIRHDIKNNLIILQQLINNNQITEANQVIDEINSHLKYKKSEVYTGNIFIDAYLSNIINNSQIDIQIKCNDLKDLHYKPDILAIIINLVDNAVENAKSLVAIQIKHEKSNSILIKVSNDCEHDPSKHLKKSKKRGDHGYGLRIVRETINQYQGTYLTSYQNKMFTTYVMLNLEGKDEK